MSKCHIKNTLKGFNFFKFSEIIEKNWYLLNNKLKTLRNGCKLKLRVIVENEFRIQEHSRKVNRIGSTVVEYFLYNYCLMCNYLEDILI